MGNLFTNPVDQNNNPNNLSSEQINRVMNLNKCTNLDVSKIVSNYHNDFNPFNIPKLVLNAPNEFTPSIAIAGCPPLFCGTKAQFAHYPIEIQAAYADGVIRGSYQKQWLYNDMLSSDYSGLNNANEAAIGALAYIYLKTKNSVVLNKLKMWKEVNYNNNIKFSSF
jgi:hypothetical protein